MVFSSELFLFVFLPAFLLLYFAAPQRWHNFVALAGSLVFYAWGAPMFLWVLLVSTWIDYWLSHRIHAEPDHAAKKKWLHLSLFANLALLLYFKYANFFVDQAQALTTAMGLGEIPWVKVVLPIGISFFTFQKISYVVDVFRGSASPSRSYGDCLLYVVLFPQLIAGPIVRYHDVDLQIRERFVDAAKFWSGVERFTLGLGKKVLIANPMAQLCDPVYATPIADVSTPHAWLAAIAYFFQIYFDFSGYSDMAMGTGRMLGFDFLENFDRPYVAKTFTDFWRRWHISLSNFMREYIYIPLGGNRVSPLRGYANLWIVFLVSGFWHGASWTFVVWGAYQGVFLTIDKLGWLAASQRVPALLLRVKMVFLVTVSWVLFRADTMTQATGMLGRMFGTDGPQWWESTLAAKLQVDAQAWAMLAVAAVAAFLPWSQSWCAFERRALAWGETAWGLPLKAALVFALLVLSCNAVVNSSHNPFIYFRF